VGVDLGQVGRVISLEVTNLLDFNVLHLIVRHEIGALDTLQWVKLALLLDHELVNCVDENETVEACRDEEALVVAELGCGDGSDLPVVLLNRKEGAWVRPV